MDKISIKRIIDILKEYFKRLGIENVTIINKLFIFKEDFFIIYNVNKIIYQYKEKLYLMKKFLFTYRAYCQAVLSLDKYIKAIS